jgi:hypothetical protein
MSVSNAPPRTAAKKATRSRSASSTAQSASVPVQPPASDAAKVVATSPAKKTARKSTALPLQGTDSNTVRPAAAHAESVKVKTKLIRDSFTMPKLEYGALDVLKLRAVALSQPVKKSELLRAGVKALSAMSDKAFLAALKVVPTIKTGRPGKG